MPLLKRYLVRSVYDWAVDSGLTPHVLVDATYAGVVVPTAYVEAGRIAFNVHPRAITAFSLDDDALYFSARFSGAAMDVFVPMAAVLAVYARENGQGISFPEPDASREESPPEGADGSPPRGPHLRIVK